MQKFTLWLEFEHVDYSTAWNSDTKTFITGGNWDKENECCNALVTLADDQQYGINVWTYKFLHTVVQLDGESGENLGGLYQRPADLFVRGCLSYLERGRGAISCVSSLLTLFFSANHSTTRRKTLRLYPVA